MSADCMGIIHDVWISVGNTRRHVMFKMSMQTFVNAKRMRVPTDCATFPKKVCLNFVNVFRIVTKQMANQLYSHLRHIVSYFLLHYESKVLKSTFKFCIICFELFIYFSCFFIFFFYLLD